MYGAVEGVWSGTDFFFLLPCITHCWCVCNPSSFSEPPLWSQRRRSSRLPVITRTMTPTFAAWFFLLPVCRLFFFFFFFFFLLWVGQVYLPMNPHAISHAPHLVSCKRRSHCCLRSAGSDRLHDLDLPVGGSRHVSDVYVLSINTGTDELGGSGLAGSEVRVRRCLLPG